VTFVGYWFVLRRASPMIDARFHLPENRHLDARLLGGAAVFGVGWGIAGFCPGGALPALGTGHFDVIAFVAALIAGIFAAKPLMAMTGARDRAGDVLQDAWVAMLRAGGDIAPGYLFAAIRSRVCDQERRPRLVVFSDPAALPEPYAEPQEEADERLGGDLADALARLRDDEREALFLTAVEGWSVESVAAHQQRPRNTVLSILHRARLKLREWMAASARLEDPRHG
jgi:RNA polymerase sigma factor (sigma-70 family)